MRLIVAGSRTFSDWPLMRKTLDEYIGDRKDVIIISGTCRGADRMGEAYAQTKNLSVERYPADWDRYGKRAGWLRNNEMADNADEVIVFMCHNSKGSKMMMNIATSRGMPCKVVNCRQCANGGCNSTLDDNQIIAPLF